MEHSRSPWENASNTMRPVTRRVTAQRKFAQGAFVPSIATTTPPTPVVVTNGTVEKKEGLPNNEDKCTVHVSNMSTEVMLDVACFQNTHGHRPIVLLERMPDPEDIPLNVITYNDPLSEVRQIIEYPVSRQRRRKTTVKKNVHVMKLRSRKFKGKAKKLKTYSRRNPKRPAPAQPTPVQPTAAQPASAQSEPPVQIKRKNANMVSAEAITQKKKVPQPIPKPTPYEFTLDDNRPLKYLATSSTPNYTTSQSQFTTIEPPAKQNARVNMLIEEAPVNPPPLSTEADKNIPENMENLGSESTFRVYYSEDIDENMQTIEENWGEEGVVLQNKQIVEAPVPTEYYQRKQKLENTEMVEAPIPTEYYNGVPGILNMNSITEDPERAVSLKKKNYYNEQVIHRWMDNSLTDEVDEVKTLPTAEIEMSETTFVQKNINSETVATKQCYANLCQTVNDVLNLSKSEYNSRCMRCIYCERIQKYMNMCTLLKARYNIDENIDNTSLEMEIPEWNPVCKHRETSFKVLKGEKLLPQLTEEVLVMEMIPKHPNIIIKLHFKSSNDLEGFYISFTTRSQANICNKFSFASHEIIIDTLLKRLDLDNIPNDTPAGLALEDQKVDLKTDQEPVAGPSGIQNNQSFTVPSDSNSPIVEDCTNDLNCNGKILSGPVYYPTLEEFADPMAYFEKIRKQTADYGICKIVPPSNFAPTCKLEDDVTFEVSDQYITRMYNRWGSASRELCAIRTCLKENKVSDSRRAMIDGVEVNLPKLYSLVQRHGGLEAVMNKNKWCKIGEEMNLAKGSATVKKLDQIYVTFLLPYDTLTSKERQDLLSMVEKAWYARHEKILNRVNNPLYRQEEILYGTESKVEETGYDVTKQTEDCVIPGLSMNLAKFKKVAQSAQSQFLGSKAANPAWVEDEYWKMVILGTEHVCVNTASIDTREQGIGFPTNSKDPYSNHKWNLKMLSQNRGNVLRSLGPVLGVTVPTLHLGMTYSSSCWHRDPHSIPWIEYEHSGPAKLWYSVPEKEGPNFCSTSKILFPMSCQNKDLWLSSDISMIPPNLLVQHNVQVYRVEQNPGEFVLVMPKAYSCSICTGYTVSESVYFATESLLDGLIKAFKEIRKSCEPTMFALEQLLWAIAEDRTSTRLTLVKIKPVLDNLFNEEIKNRRCLEDKGVRVVKFIRGGEPSTSKGKRRKSISSKPAMWNVRDLDECEICRCTLYLSKVKNIPQRDSFLCLEHSLLYIACRGPIVDMPQLEMHYIVTTEQLKSVMNKLRQRLDRGP